MSIVLLVVMTVMTAVKQAVPRLFVLKEMINPWFAVVILQVKVLAGFE